MSKFAVILPAAGASSRFGDANCKKPFAPLAGKAVWMHSAERFMDRADVKQVLLVLAEEDREYFKNKFGAAAAMLGVSTVSGGANRTESVANALAKVGDDVDFVCVHDAARPLLADKWIDQIFVAAEKHDAAIFASPVSSTVKRVDGEKKIIETVPREGLWAAQTPQVFRRELLVEAYAKRGEEHATDDAQLVERLGATRDRPARQSFVVQDHHQGRPAPGRAGDQGAAQAEISTCQATPSPTTAGGDGFTGV